MLRQRVFGLALGYEDVNDHRNLRHDLALQTAAERDRALASPSTLSRFENAAGRDWAWSVHEALVEDFIASHSEPPEELVLDFDATDDAVHGKQEGRFFHGYYDHYCFLPLYVFCGERLLVAYLRPSKIDGARHAWAILALLVKRLRQAWPGVRIILRGDSGFCRYKMLSWCERHGVGTIVGLAKNARLNDLAASWMETAAKGFAESGVKQRRFDEFRYAAGTWTAERRVIASPTSPTARARAQPRASKRGRSARVIDNCGSTPRLRKVTISWSPSGAAASSILRLLKPSRRRSRRDGFFDGSRPSCRWVGDCGAAGFASVGCVLLVGSAAAGGTISSISRINSDAGRSEGGGIWASGLASTASE